MGILALGYYGGQSNIKGNQQRLETLALEFRRERPQAKTKFAFPPGNNKSRHGLCRDQILQRLPSLQNLIAVEPLSALIIARGESGFGLRLGPFTAAFERQRFEALLIALDIGLPTLVPER